MAHAFHWRHGWIPLDHAAQVSKDHGHIPAKDTKPAPATRREIARAVQTIGNLPPGRDRQQAIRKTVVAAHTHDARELIPPAWEARFGKGAQVRAAAIRAHDTAMRAEPELTARVQALAGKHGGEVHGLHHAVKGVDSLSRKIAADTNEGTTPAEAAAQLSDVNRYTVHFPADRYSASVQAAIDGLNTTHQAVRVKNFFNAPDNPYQGVNVQLVDKAGRRSELQFHTPETQAGKDRLHGVYEKTRVSVDDAEIAAHIAQAHRISRTIPVPHNASTIH